MSLSPSELWSAWQTSPEIRELAEAWLTKREGEWTDDDERLYSILHSEPDRVLSVMFAAIQLTDDKQILGGLAAGPLEDFLGVHGEACRIGEGGENKHNLLRGSRSYNGFNPA